MSEQGSPAQILVVGGGYVGMYTALRLQRKLRLSRGEATVTVVDPQSYMTYQPFMAETAAGSLEPRHMVVPLRRVLKHCRVITGVVAGLDPNRQIARVVPAEGDEYDLPYDHVVIAPGSIARTLPIPGLNEMGIGFKTVAEAVYLRNYVLSRLDAAASTVDADLRRCALTFVFVGGGYAGVEAFAELEDMAQSALKADYSNIRSADMRWVLVEASGRILAEVSPVLGEYTVERLKKRGMEIHLNTRLESCVDGHVVLSDGTTFDAETLVWTAGVQPEPILAKFGIPLDDKKRLPAAATLRVTGFTNVWSAGDCAAVPDLSKDPGSFCSPTAQHAVRQSKVLADNIVRSIRGGDLHDYRHKFAGSVASLGLHKGVAEIYGIKMRGMIAWLMHRTYHVSRVPTINRKTRVLADWTLALFFPREIVSLGQFADPRAAFRAAATHAPDPSLALEAPQPQPLAPASGGN